MFLFFADIFGVFSFTLVLDALGITVDDKSDEEELRSALAPALAAAQGNPRLLCAIAGACSRKHLAVMDDSGRLSHVDRAGITQLAGHADDLQATVVQVAIDACSPAAARILSVASTLEEPFSRSLLRGVAMEVEVQLDKRSVCVGCSQFVRPISRCSTAQRPPRARGVGSPLTSSPSPPRSKTGLLCSRSSGAHAPPTNWADEAIDELLNDVQLLEASASDDALLRFAQANVSRAVYAAFHASGKRAAHREALATSEREIGLPEELLQSDAGKRLLVQAVYEPRAVAHRVGALLPSLVRHARGALSRVVDADDARAVLGGSGDADHVDEGLYGALRLAAYGLVLASELFDCCMLDECIALCDEIRALLESATTVHRHRRTTPPPTVALLLLRVRQLLGEALCVSERAGDSIVHLEAVLKEAGEGLLEDVPALLARLAREKVRCVARSQTYLLPLLHIVRVLLTILTLAPSPYIVDNEKALQQLRDASGAVHPMISAAAPPSLLCTSSTRGGASRDQDLLPTAGAVARLLACRVFERLAKVYFQSGRPLDAIYCCWRGVNLALELCGDGGAAKGPAALEAQPDRTESLGLTPELARAYVCLSDAAAAAVG